MILAVALEVLTLALGRFPEPGDDELLAGPSRGFQVFDPLDFLGVMLELGREEKPAQRWRRQRQFVTKEQLRENITRSGHRSLALDLAPGLVFQRRQRLWETLRGHLLRFGRQAADRLAHQKPLRRRMNSTTPHHGHHQTT